MMNDNICMCMNCSYGLEVSDLLYECRRYAPRMIHGVGTVKSQEMFPIVRLDDWCGEYQPKEESEE